MMVFEVTTPDGFVLSCAQCGRAAPTDPVLLRMWRSSFLSTSPLDELTAKMVLCPACLDEDSSEAFDSAAGD